MDTYQSFGGQTPGCYLVCGTSEATPLFSGIVALADQVAGHRLGLINPYLYALSAADAKGIVDITKGNNTASFPQNGHLDTVGASARCPATTGTRRRHRQRGVLRSRAGQLEWHLTLATR